MPLPDERPRQSVANLIGRFETQNKRASQALSAGSPSRSSSVVSHVTGDSVKEEIKERREWPPKSVVEGDKSPPSLSSRNIPPALVTQSSFGESNRWKKDAPTEEIDVPLTAKALNASERQTKGEPNAFLENWRKELPSAQIDVGSTPTPTASAPDEGLKTPKPASTQKLGTTATPRTPATKAATSKLPASAASMASKTPAKTPAKSPAPKHSLTPLKPQHTGQSVASSATTKKAVTKAPTTPASSITPSRSEAATRAKTPTSSAHPKTPSIGLFAPTAASLARSRNAPPPVPTPAKKTAISSSSMDRLSKPTAASKAKVASPPTLSPSRPAASSASRTPAKPKVATSPPKVKKTSSVPQAASGAAVSASIATIGLASAASAAANIKEAVAEDVTDVTDSAVNIASSDTNTILPVDQPTESTEKAPSQSEEYEHTEAVPEEETLEETQEEAVEAAEAVASEENGTTLIFSPAEAEGATETFADPATQTEAPEPTQSENHEVKDDLEQMVTLLESVSITKPLEDTIADIPDEILEIPDEEEK